ncbi:MAG: hypothetical protein RMM98_10115 [Acidobacteriota bacterium]|nr:hypothetical protein [Blastocatellia bacterium]MDW8239959.1 hypothetical protein [Acidobacteriota bacterium]
MPKLLQYLEGQNKQELLLSTTRLERFLFALERAIIEVQRNQFSDLTDEEVLAGVDNALKTYQTLDRGIIYEHPSESPRIHAVTDSVIKLVDKVRHHLQQNQQSSLLTTRDIITCLQFLSEAIQYDRQSGKGPRAWISNATLYQPYPPQETSSVIVPG